jgi:chromosome segregation protein
MRLISLKLAGFKSFVDSTTLVFPQNRTAVVGPNGCGKSNVIDAIRWVMGESSARQLRGGSMTDVIFAGTSQRKPVGQASVELRFENTYGKLGGEYNAYTELSVRRQVSRDGKSDYFLNGTRCRRRDITNIFLGTGLGPRSYAIIEQGMINRLVDAKPEEMRVFIEEAAGVSRYQARRRETMQHLDHTRQNLARLQDVADELQSQMRVLKRQSQAALRYRELEQQLRQLKIQLWSAHVAQAVQQQQGFTEQMTLLGDDYRQLRTQRNQAEQDWQQGSQIVSELLSKAEPIQQAWQQAERDVSQVQAWLQQYEHDQSQREQQRQQWQHNLDAILQQIAQDISREKELQHFLHDGVARLQLVDQQYRQAESHFLHIDQQRHQAEESYQTLKQQLQHQEQQQQKIQQQIDAASRARHRLEQQIQQASTQLEQLNGASQQDDLLDLDSERDELLFKKAQLEQKITALLDKKIAQQQALDAIKHDLKQQQALLLTDQSELAALQKLLNKTQPQPKKQSTLSMAAPLFKQLKFSVAAQPHLQLIEKFIADWLNAVEQVGVQSALDAARSYQAQQTALPSTVFKHPEVTAFLEWIEQPHLSCWCGVGVVSDHQRALSLQSQLSPDQTLLSLDGYWMGQNWVINLNVDEQAARQQGVLQQQQRLQQLQQQIAQLQAAIEPLNSNSQQIESVLHELQPQIKQLEQQQTDVGRQLQQIELQRARLESTLQSQQQQQEQLKRQLIELQQTQQDDHEQLAEWQMELATASMRAEQVRPKAQQQQQQLTVLQQESQHALAARQQLQQQQQQLQHELNAKQAEQHGITQALARAQVQQDSISPQLQQLAQATTQADSEYPAQAQRLLDAQEVAGQAHSHWTTWQQQLEQRQRDQQHLSELRQQGQQQEDQLRDQLEQARLHWQNCKNRIEQAEEQLKLLDAEAIDVEISALDQYQRDLDKVQQQIQKLGDLNLAAPHALDEVNERFNELDHQMKDLQSTIDQLEQAMKNIDQETRTLFMGTFNQVNEQLQILFPKVFGGGEASLSLEDDWQSGVKLMARPPGKRNSSLALLSGGEKALTALALVFAIFRLNPAPFCVLDEVDAPLDDANVQRYCNLVKELSQQVQFIYITHNKVAMTMATDLLGVTMPEAGASRLVAVNIEQAAKFGATLE